MTRWRKLGRVFCPDNNRDWMVSHAAYPVAVPRDDTTVRVYFACRDGSSRSSVGFIEIDPRSPAQVLRVSERPALSPGQLGTFDDSGVTVGSVVSPGAGPPRLYYLGWSLCRTVPWRNSIGLAVGDAGGDRFERVPPAPLLHLNEVDPFTMTYPWVLKEGTRWRLWYGSNTTWGAAVADARHVIKYAESDDGVTFRREGRVALGLNPGETIVCRPTVVPGPDGYQMWFTHGWPRYRIGYAVSSDGLSWERRDEGADITVSESGWDSEMVAYPSVFDHRGERYLLYNGNGCGRAGFGLAVRERD